MKLNASVLKNHLSSPRLAIILITLVAAVIYSNICHFPFVFDDLRQITYGAEIRDLTNSISLNKLLWPRTIVDLTFALNYRFGKLDVFGYHLVNILIHVMSGFLVYFLALTVFKRLCTFPLSSNSLSPGPQNPLGAKIPDPRLPQPSSRDGGLDSIRFMSLFTALIFIAHPIQTQAVTYTIQRYTSMAAMFYMASVFFYLKARILAQCSREKTKVRLSALYALSCLSGILAFLSKQNTASLPVTIALVEYFLIDKTWQGWKKKIPWFSLALVIWVIFILFVSGFFRISGFFNPAVQGSSLLEDVSRVMVETKTVTKWSYLCTQFNVLVIYIRLLFLPIRQNADYFYPFKTGLFDGYTAPAFLFLAFIVGLGIWNIKRRPLITFGIFWFFITLAVESSIIPISDALFEHRLYLPIFGFALVVIYLLFRLLSKNPSWPIIISLIIIVSLGTATYVRNKTWQDSITLWSDVVSKNPLNNRAHNNLGLSLAGKGRTAEAIDHYSEALRINPDHLEAHNNLGLALVAQGKITEAIRHYSEALRIAPEDADTHVNLGNALVSQGNTDEAIDHYSMALHINPEHAGAHNNLGNALAAQGKLNEAIDHYSEALRISPDRAEYQKNMGIALAKQGRTADAVRHYSEALRINPGDVETHNNLGLALASQGKGDEAIRHYSEALRIDPYFKAAHYNLGIAFVAQGKFDEAIRHYSEALRIDPSYPEAHNNLGTALIRTGKIEDAIFHFREALRTRPDYSNAQKNLKAALAAQGQKEAPVTRLQEALTRNPQDPTLHYKLGILYQTKGQLDEAIEHYKKALSIQPGFFNALSNLARVHTIKMEYDKALSIFNKMIGLRPDNAGIYYNIACIYAKQNKREGSVDWLKKAVGKGYDNWALIKTDKDLENIRGSLYYKEFIKGR